MITRSDAIEVLRNAGIAHPVRVSELISATIQTLGLDLSGLAVLTEAASGPFVVTPVISALAGARRTVAITGESRFATTQEVIDQTRALETLCGLSDAVEIVTGRNIDLFSEADIVTNLGFVRPIDAQAVTAMKPSAAVPLMCEAWEHRGGDVDLDACRARGIPVLGTNEDYPDLDVFSYSGPLCMKMLFEAGIELHKSKILVVSSDKFGGVIERALARTGAEVFLAVDLRSTDTGQLSRADALVVADYTRSNTIIGPGGDIETVDLARLAGQVTVIQFAGRIDAAGLVDQGITVYPGLDLPARRMSMTLGALGPRPVIELHAAGLKVGEAIARAFLEHNLSHNAAVRYALQHSPAQQLVE